MQPPQPAGDSAQLHGRPLHWARVKLECKGSRMYVYVCVCVCECVCEINVKENLGCNRHTAGGRASRQHWVPVDPAHLS